MTDSQFQEQVERLKVRFGPKSLDGEFLMLIWKEVRPMDLYDFQTTVDVLISSRPANRPPLLVDFREARLRASKTCICEI